MHATHKKSPTNPHAILDDVPDKEQRLLGGMQGLKDAIIKAQAYVDALPKVEKKAEARVQER